MLNPRILCWFSCGAASAVATKRTIELYSATHTVEPCYCNTLASEHPDNARFLAEAQAWFGCPVRILSSDQYVTIDDVFAATRYMSGVRGARCTTELKKIPRLRYAQPDDTHVFGFTVEEKRRMADFKTRNPDMKLLWVLRDLGITKRDCYTELLKAGIELPAMYQLGFNNNNCPGCVKATSPWYWSMIRKHFPDVFKRRCQQSRALGVRLVEIRHHERIFLDELPWCEFKPPRRKENLSCGPECGGPANA